jgi:Arc/MetJ-type ribon-helix-helix transcriptional regulator
MKKRISATVDKKTEEAIESILKDGSFRNKSHIIEKAIELLKKQKENEKK